MPFWNQEQHNNKFVNPGNFLVPLDLFEKILTVAKYMLYYVIEVANHGLKEEGEIMDRLIFHVDVNSAYLSWTAVKLLSEGKKDIRLIPSAVGGDKEKRTGIILAKSIPAKKFGVTTGEPVAAALRKCPKLVLVQPDFGLYERNSKAFMEICRKYAPVVEKFSIDECFLDMTGTQTLYPNPVEIATVIKDQIYGQLGFTVNVGIGPNKLLAKIASDFEKPDKVHTLFP